MKGGHVQMLCTDDDCSGSCNACCLAWGSVCGGAEGSLPTECPKTKMTNQQSAAVYLGTLDYYGGHWKAQKAGRGAAKTLKKGALR